MQKEQHSRLTSQERRKALLEAARQVFFVQGFNDARIDDIISLSGGSKRSIYKEFGGKEGLFLTLLSESLLELGGELDVYVSESSDSENLAVTLEAVSHMVLEALLKPDVLKMRRLVMAEGLRFPQLVGHFPELGPDKVRNIIAGILEHARHKGEVRLEDATMAADMLMGMLESNLVFHVALRIRERPERPELEKRVNMAVDIFLNGIGYAGKRSPA